MIQHDARHPEMEQEQGSLLHVTALCGTQDLTDGQQLSTQLREPGSHCADASSQTTSPEVSCLRRLNENQVTKPTLPQAVGLDEVVDSAAYSLEVIQILTDIPSEQEESRGDQ